MNNIWLLFSKSYLSWCFLSACPLFLTPTPHTKILFSWIAASLDTEALGSNPSKLAQITKKLCSGPPTTWEKQGKKDFKKVSTSAEIQKQNDWRPYTEEQPWGGRPIFPVHIAQMPPPNPCLSPHHQYSQLKNLFFEKAILYKNTEDNCLCTFLSWAPRHRTLSEWLSSVQFSRSVVSNSVRPHELQHARPPITNSRSLPKLMSIESVMPSNHLILCHPLLLLPSIFPSIRVFSNESAVCIRQPKYWSFSFNISPSNEHSGLFSFRMDWLDLLAVQGTLKSLLQHHSSKFFTNSSELSFLNSPSLTSTHN